MTKMFAGISLIATAMLYAQGDPPVSGAGRGGRGASPNLPTKAQWDSNARTQEYVAKAKAIAGNDPDLQFDFAVFCQASGGSTNEDRARLGVPNSVPHLTPYPAPNPKVSL